MKRSPKFTTSPCSSSSNSSILPVDLSGPQITDSPFSVPEHTTAFEKQDFLGYTPNYAPLSTVQVPFSDYYASPDFSQPQFNPAHDATGPFNTNYYYNSDIVVRQNYPPNTFHNGAYTYVSDSMTATTNNQV